MRSVAVSRWVAVAILVGASPAWSAEGPFDLSWHVGAEARYDDNLGLAPDNDSQRDQVTHRLEGGAAWQAVQTTRDEVSVGATAFYQLMDRFHDLDKLGIDVDGRYRRQFGDELTAPWAALRLTGTWHEHENSDLRDGYVLNAEVSLGRQFGAGFGASLGYRYRQQWSTDDNPRGGLAGRDSDEVFDQESDGPFVRVEVLPTPRSTVFVEYNYMSGDVASTGSPDGFINPAEFPAARDFAFEQGIDFLVWKVEADQDIYSLGGDYAVTDRITVDLSASYLDAKAESGNDYENWRVSLGLSFGF